MPTLRTSFACLGLFLATILAVTALAGIGRGTVEPFVRESSAPIAQPTPSADPVPDIAGEIAAGLERQGCKVETTGNREYTLKSC